jgi:hypothetical protein
MNISSYSSDYWKKLQSYTQYSYNLAQTVSNTATTSDTDSETNSTLATVKGRDSLSITPEARMLMQKLNGEATTSDESTDQTTESQTQQMMPPPPPKPPTDGTGQSSNKLSDVDIDSMTDDEIKKLLAKIKEEVGEMPGLDLSNIDDMSEEDIQGARDVLNEMKQYDISQSGLQVSSNTGTIDLSNLISTSEDEDETTTAQDSAEKAAQKMFDTLLKTLGKSDKNDEEEQAYIKSTQEEFEKKIQQQMEYLQKLSEAFNEKVSTLSLDGSTSSQVI